MLTTSKLHGATSSAGLTKRGTKGRLELWASRNGDRFTVNFADFGNYGSARWGASFGEMDENGILDIIESLQELLAGDIETTKVPFVEPQPEPVSEPEIEAEAEEVEAEAEATEEAEMPAEVVEASESDTDQIEA